MNYSTHIKAKNSVFFFQFLVWWALALVLFNIYSIHQIESYNSDFVFQIISSVFLIIIPGLVFKNIPKIGKLILFDKGIKIYSKESVEVFSSSYRDLEFFRDVQTTQFNLSIRSIGHEKSLIVLKGKESTFKLSSDQIDEYVLISELEKRNVEISENIKFSLPFYLKTKLIMIIAVFFAIGLSSLIAVERVVKFNLIN